MNDLDREIARMASDAVSMSETRGGRELDYTEASLVIVEQMLDESASYVDDMTPEQSDLLVHTFGCYIIEVAHREFGGTYYWDDKRDQPILVVGEPKFHVSILTWD